MYTPLNLKTGQNNIFSIAIILNSQSQVWYLIVSIPDLCTLTYFSCLFKEISKAVENSNPIQGIQQYIKGNCIKFQMNIQYKHFLWVCAKYSKSIQTFANFTIGMTGNETGHSQECVKHLWKIYQYK